MYNVNNLTNNDDIAIIDQKAPFTVIEYKRDLSVTPETAMTAYFCNEMNVRKRQVICSLSQSNGITCQAGSMQWSVGNVNATTGIKGVGDLFGKAVRGKVTGESAIKPEYTGNGTLVLEPTYKHIILIDLNDWNGSIVLDDGLFLACDSSVKHKAVMRSNISSAIAGGEGLFNLSLNGTGVCCLECDCPKEELVEIYLENDVLKVDGNFAIAWSSTLDFTVERSGKSLIGSAASGEGLVNVYRGTGKVLLAPIDRRQSANALGKFLSEMAK
ncbi:MAG: AIM24 family protein [Clostridia bacterium]|nr:AIM24 family protein [Clostridia bacterium]